MYVCVYIVATYAYDLSDVPKEEVRLCMCVCVSIVVTYAYNRSEVPKEEVRVCLYVCLWWKHTRIIVRKYLNRK